MQERLGQNVNCLRHARAHYERAKAAGAEIILDLADDRSQGRGYSCRDPEGHIWNFGTYDPWKRQSRPAEPRRRHRAGPRRVLRAGLTLAFMGLAIVAGMAGWTYGGDQLLSSIEAIAAPVPDNVPIDVSLKEARSQLARERVAREVADRSLREMREQLARERSGQDAAQRGSRELTEQLASERNARAAAERAATEARARAAEEQAARQAVERSAQAAAEQWAEIRNRDQMQRQAARETATGEAAERAAGEMRERLHALEVAAAEADQRLTQERAAREALERTAQEQLTRERGARETAERSAKDAREQLARIAAANTRRPERPRARPSQPSSTGLFW